MELMMLVVFPGIFIALLVGVGIHYQVVKKNYYRSHDGMSRMVNKRIEREKLSLGDTLTYTINENLKIEVSYFIGFFEMAIYQKKDGNWSCEKRKSEDIWNQFNSLLPIKGPWKQEIDAFLKKEYQKNA